MVQRALPDDRIFARGVRDTLGLLKVSGIGAQLFFKGLKDPAKLMAMKKELQQQVSMLPEHARFILENYAIDPATGTVQQKKAMNPREDYMAEVMQTATE